MVTLDLVTVNGGLPIGTRVRKTTSRYERLGVVMQYEPEHTHDGTFPVRFDDGVWEVLDTHYVTVMAPPAGDEVD